MPRAGNDRWRRRNRAGFTLLELLIAMAIFALAATYLFSALAQSPDKARRAKLNTIASFLARAKLVEIEAEMKDPKEARWEEFDDQECGDFKDDEYGGMGLFQWCATIEKVELPEGLDMQGVIEKVLGLGNQTGGSGGLAGAGGLLGALGGLADKGKSSDSSSAAPGAPKTTSGLQQMIAPILGQMFNSFKSVVEQAIRLVTLRVFWKYNGRERELKLYYYVTRPELVQQAIISGLAGAAGQPGATGQPGKSGTRTGARPGSGGRTRGTKR